MITLNQPIVMQHPKDPDNWILVEDFRYKENDVVTTIPKGFVTDFASIPRVFWSVINPTELGDAGPIKHDWKYRNGIGTRAQADKAFLADMEDDGIGWWKRKTAYGMVRAFGWGSWKSGKVIIEQLQPAG